MDGVNYQDSPEGQEMSGSQGAEPGRPFLELDRKIHKLMREGLGYPPGSARRRIVANKIVRLMQQSGKIWHRPEPYYEDALSKTWEYFSKNLWEATTAETAFCDPDCFVMARFNAYLKKRLLDAGIAQTEARKEQARLKDVGGDDAVAVAERLAAPESVLDEPSQRIQQADRVREVIETDSTGELGQTHVRGKPDITAQLLLRRRGLESEPWQRLAMDLESRVPTLSSFYQRKCLPLLRQLLGAPERN